ncbi:SOS response-associated peptidase [Lachnospiraceae bacterium NSJ-143]|nr:SOS response-associated peptidase [Lachnospiraceae bacterium NSJ-143]
MCGRFFVGPEIIDFVKYSAICFDTEFTEIFDSEDIYPSQMACVLYKKEESITAIPLKWGFKISCSPALLINIRAETALLKRTFVNAVHSRRCVIPASGFYEWSSNGEKSKFFRKDSKPLYMAGIYETDGYEDRFAVITTSANDSVESVHVRMPLIIENSQLNQWLNNGNAFEKVLNQKPIELDRKTDYEQIRLF